MPAADAATSRGPILRPRQLHAVTGRLARALLTMAAIFGLVPAAARAESRAAARIVHGIELDRSRVGPAAAGLSALAEQPGTEIRDGREPPFASAVPVGATYDGFRVDGPHLLVERIAFTGPVDIYTRRPVVLRGVSIRTRNEAHWALHTRPEAGPVLFLWSSAGAASIEGAPNDRSRALARALYLRSDAVTVYRSHLNWTADGIQIHARGARIVESLIDGLTLWTGDHNDGIQMLGRGADAVISRSRIVNDNPQTSCLNLVGDAVRVEDSYLAGGGWTVYAGGHHPPRQPGMTRNVVFSGNIFGRDRYPKGGSFGAVTGWDAAGAGNVWRGNRWSDGAALDLGQPPPRGR